MKRDGKKDLPALLLGMAFLGILYLAEGSFENEEETAGLYTLTQSIKEETDSCTKTPESTEASGQTTDTDTAAEADVSDTASLNETESPASENDGRININTAGIEELKALSGIGDVRAAAIIAYRESHGVFQSAEEIMNVSGIGEGIYGKIRDKIRV